MTPASTAEHTTTTSLTVASLLHPPTAPRPSPSQTSLSKCYNASSSASSSPPPSHFSSGYSCLLLRRYRPQEFFATVTTTIQLFSLDIQMARIIIPQSHSHDRLAFKFCRLCTNVCKLCDVDGDDVHFSSLNDGGGSTYTSFLPSQTYVFILKLKLHTGSAFTEAATLLK